jgi:uncharacterized protein (TIGR02246 family)
MSPSRWLVAGALLLVPAAAVVSRAQDNADERAVIRLTRDICAAEARGDTGPLERLWADDYFQVSSSGRVDSKKEQFALMRSGTFKLDQIDVKEIRARVYGDAAVVNDLLAVRGQISGRRLDGQVRSLRVFVRREGRWQCHATQYTLVAAPPAAGR